MPNEYPALSYLLDTETGRLYPEERKELVALLARVRVLEQVNQNAEALVKALCVP